MNSRPKICVVDGCENEVHCRACCGKHYQRLLKYGDPLGGRTFVGEPLAFFEQTVLTHDGDDCLIWPYGRDSKGYGKIQHEGRCHFVSRLACEAEHGPPPTPEHEAAHLCGKGHEGCCNRRHMAWKTSAENALDKVRHSTAPIGSRNGRAKLTEADARNIRVMRKRVSARQIARQYGVCLSTVNRILSGKRWVNAA